MCKSTHSSMPACIRRSYDVVTYNKLYACRMSHTLNTILRVRDPIRGFPIYIEKISVNIYRVGGYHYILNYRLAMPSILYEEQHDGTKLRHDKNVTPGRAAVAARQDQRGQYAHVRCVDLYLSIVLLAWSLARSDEINLSAIAVKREILQSAIAYCSLDL